MFNEWIGTTPQDTYQDIASNSSGDVVGQHLFQ
jgi:hypothetical protein